MSTCSMIGSLHRPERISIPPQFNVQQELRLLDAELHSTKQNTGL